MSIRISDLMMIIVTVELFVIVLNIFVIWYHNLHAQQYNNNVFKFLLVPNFFFNCENCFLFQEIRRTRKTMKNTFDSFFFFFFFFNSGKTQRTHETLDSENNNFQKTPIWCFLCF